MALVEILGFVIPLEWVIAVSVSFVVLIIVFFLLIFRGKGEVSPIQEDLALISPIDQHNTIQVGKLIGGCERTETELIVRDPDWKDDEGEQPSEQRVDIEKIVPFPFFDSNKALKRLWLIKDVGHLEAVSASTMTSNSPVRYDPPFADRKKAGRFLIGRWSGGAGNLLQGKKGVMFIGSLVILSTVMFLFGYFVAA